MIDSLHKKLPDEVRTWIGLQLFEQVPSNIVVINRDFRIIGANRNFVEVFGTPEGKYCYQVYKRRNRICENCMAARTFRDGKVRINDEVGFDRKDKAAHYVVHIAPVFNDTGQVEYVIEMSYDVTETKYLQREYNILFERVPCYVAVINRDLKIVRTNERLRETFGDCVGEFCYEVYKNHRKRCPDCPALKTFIDGGYYTSSQEGTRKDGSPIHYVVSTAPLSRTGKDFSHVIEMSADVTEVHKLARELNKENIFRRNITENAIDALVGFNDAGRVNIFNSAAEKLFKYAASEIIGKSTAGKFFPDLFRDQIQTAEPSLLLPEVLVNDKNGEEIPVRFSGSMVHDDGELLGGAAFFQDLRELKKLEKEKLEHERFAAVGQTVAQLAHGIKNILTGLQGGMYALKTGIQKGSADRITKGWDMLDRNVDRITQLVKGFLSISKGHVPEVELTNPNLIAEEIYNLYKDAAGQEGIELLFKPASKIKDAFMDPKDIHTCLANLVANAIDACKVSEKENNTVTLSVHEENGTIVYQVADTGCGMDYEIKSKVFTTFFTTKGLGGTGLGLLVTRKIVQEHNGQIKVESSPGEGSLFRIEFQRDTLPVPQDDDEHHAAARSD